MLESRRIIHRRTFLADLGRGAAALAIVGVAARPAAAQSPSPAAPVGASPAMSPTPGASASPGPSMGALDWERVNLGFVSAYVLVRGGEAAIVDTGTEGSADAIEASLGAVGLDWTAVGHLVLTHHHGDHAGSAAAVMERALDAAGYAGAEDIPSIVVPRPLTVVADGDDVFGLQVVTAPGHTAGSICVLDPVGSILVAGDALTIDAGRPAPPGAEFTADMAMAVQSIVKLGSLTFETLLVGHGDPIEAGASTLVAELGATL
jgi:glyoxylase-like metal-dependent hydrolase (beta-lactamase superfamily II)